jgi:penicillin amidase
VPHILGATTTEALRGLGFCHGFDRGLQMALGRIIGMGRAAATLEASDALVALDTLFLRLDLARGASIQIERLAPRNRERLQAYCDGVNQAFAERVPWELRLARHRPPPWQPTDAVLLMRLMGYLGLAQSQGDIERAIVELLHGGTPVELIEELLPGGLAMLDLELLRDVRLETRVLAPLPAQLGLPSLGGSNAWAVAPRLTAGGAALLAGDPHLAINQIPATWCEAVIHHGGRWCAGATIPGLPAVLVGRNRDVAWSLTYGGADATDSWIEECRAGCCLREVDGEQRWVPFSAREATLERRGGEPLTLSIYENEHGLLDGDPYVTGRYLCTRWAAAHGTGATSLDAVFELLFADDCDGAITQLRTIELSFNWIVADAGGAIAHQMSGRLPRRAEGTTGLVPLPGWDARHDWDGFLAPHELPCRRDPAEGFVASANDDINHLAATPIITLPIAPYRLQRIEALLRARADWSVADFEAMQMDRLSLQAVRYLDVLRPLLAGDERFDPIGRWDCVYDDDSREAGWFEAFYAAFLERALTSACNAETAAFILHETTITAAIFGMFDDALLRRESAWHGAGGRDAALLRAAQAAFAAPPQTLAQRQPLVLEHLLLAGRVPRWMGFDRPTPGLRGGRATIHQGQKMRTGGRDVLGGPSYRMVTDLGRALLRTALPGGPSDRRSSRWYASDVEDWWRGHSKSLQPR